MARFVAERNPTVIAEDVEGWLSSLALLEQVLLDAMEKLPVRVRRSALYHMRKRLDLPPVYPSTAEKNKRKTECKRGHPLSGGNLQFRSNGTRRCLACTHMHNKNRVRRKA